MKTFLTLSVLLCPILASTAWGQTNFRAGYEKAAPIPPTSTLSLEEKVKVHQDFLDKATHVRDTLQRLYAFMYLYYDYLNANEYPEAMRYLLEAETLAKASGKPGWQGWVMHRRGLLSLRMRKYKDAIPSYEAAAELCRIAGDSLCLGESLCQIGTMYASLKDYKQAHRYCEASFPMIEKYGGEAQLGVALNNFGILLANQELHKEAIPYYERSISIDRKLGMHKEEAQGLNNLAGTYRSLYRYDLSLETYKQCMKINQEFHMPENLITNYKGLALLYEDKGDLGSALDCIIDYYELRDSLIGANTQKEITTLELKYASQQKELELQKSQLVLGAAQRSLERGGLLVLFLLLLVAFGLWRWRTQTYAVNRERLQNQENLNNLTHLLLEKNTRLIELEEQTSEQLSPIKSSTETADFEDNLYYQRILTHEDWAAFKVYFEKVYPGYIQRLRTTYPSISDAEKRLFLFIKLNLTTKEAAAILGISAESVKKTRNRLRHRLELGQEDVLEEYIHAF